MEHDAFVYFKISANRLRVVRDLVFYFNFQLFIFDVDLKTTQKFGDEYLEELLGHLCCMKLETFSFELVVVYLGLSHQVHLRGAAPDYIQSLYHTFLIVLCVS
jgi:hypothetical protein